MRVLVCGGRDYADRAAVFEILDRVHAHRGIDCIIHGAARGADTLAEDWAKDRQVPYQGFPARWKADGKSAGPIRNGRMLQVGDPDAVIAFPGGNGTADMVQRAKDCSLPVWEPAKNKQEG